MAKAFQKTGIDRNTMALSAPLAKIMLVKPKFLKTLPAFDMGTEKLMDYIKRCSSAATPELKGKIEKWKSAGKLLPITHKFR